jgi:hypothetical protein
MHNTFRPFLLTAGGIADDQIDSQLDKSTYKPKA